MDFSNLPESQRDDMMKLIEQKQAQQFLKLYNFIVNRCFEDCINDFSSKTLSGKEEGCINKCSEKMLKHTNRIGQRMAEKQMTPDQLQ